MNISRGPGGNADGVIINGIVIECFVLFVLFTSSEKMSSDGRKNTSRSSISCSVGPSRFHFFQDSN
jgi:hypothetical protein